MLALLMLITSLSIIDCVAQESVYRIVYIDNSSPSSSDRLSTGQINSLNQLVEQLKVEETPFTVFGSNGKNPQIISGTTSLNDFESLILRNNSKIPDQFQDLELLREACYPKIEKFNPSQIRLDIIGSESFMKNILTGISPIVKLFPQEISDLYGKVVEVNLHTPKIAESEESFQGMMLSELSSFEKRKVKYEYFMEE